MKKLILAFFGLLILALSSCKLPEDGKGTLVVRNENGDTNVEITKVFVWEKKTSGYNLVFTGSIKNDQSHFISLDPGYYSIMITATTTALGIFSSSKNYDLYNIQEELKEDKFLTVIFDGNGLYFE